MSLLKSLSISIACVFPALSYASPQKLPHIEGFNNELKVGATLVFKAESGHHFNQDSPLGCGNEAPIKIQNNTLSCTYKEAGEFRAFLAVCDDAKKYCKIFRPTILVGKASPKKAQKGIAKKQTTHHGFKLGNPEATLEANFKSKTAKPVLLDFFALWCPPCNDLDELIFPTALFVNETKNIEKIKINVDEEESWALKEKFKIVGYPTLIYLNPRGEEVGRFWGTQSPEFLVSWIQKMKRLEAMPISWAAQQSDPENVQRVVEWNYDLGNYAQVKTLTGARKEEWAQKFYLRAEESLASEAKDNKARIKHLSALIKKFPADIRLGYWVLDLAKLDKKLATKSLNTAIENTNSWMNRSEEAIKENYSLQDLVLLKTDLFESFEKKEELKKAQSEAIAFFEKELAGGKKISRGRSHILAYFYRETGRLEDAKKIYEAIVNENPKEFTFYFRYARVLNDLKEYTAALTWLEKGAPYMTEGNSRFQYSWLKGKILNALGKKAEALQIVDGTLAIAKAPNWEKDSANRWIKDLGTLKSEIISEKTP